ncbi:beta-lysine acetyltransferase [Maridesulfovibrio ferrireducens]|uniref:Beta-lysine acetyltransferase n=1 Tax=Maridesulfovibrio ferrireducens TaxID=246191 RepID=A0A1G9B7Z6_9BACT|nr:putative beta-lysine N-acetyltransferase [Maridesulfovibrio ferrireducens]SDK35686.1 beta-lysine acetyltransferase [Maridesulfovibrio ferrireducens]
MIPDKIISIGQSKIQIGPLNDRIYLMDLSPDDMPEILFKLKSRAEAANVSKIFAKIPRACLPDFVAEGFTEEASVPNLFSNDDGSFLSLYRQPWRETIKNQSELDKVIAVAKSKSGAGVDNKLEEGLKLRKLTAQDCQSLADLYKEIFSTYPFPVHDADFIKHEMDQNGCFYGVFHNDKLIGAASAEAGSDGWSAELTDFAVLPAYRKKGIAGSLLHKLEKESAATGKKCFFTIARACSYGVNSLFAKAGYTYSGTIPNNTNISGGLETMNIWFKHLS